MKILPINNINFKNTENIPSKKETEKKVDVKTEEKTTEKKKKNITVQVALGLIAASSIWMLIRTDKTRIQKIIADEKKGIKGRLGSGTLEIEIHNFKNNKNVKSLDELSGLENVKEFINNYQTLLQNPSAMQEHNIQEFSSLLFWGVPGTGKTSAAKGIAKKLDADYIQIDKEFFDSMFASEAPKNLADIFEQIEFHAKSNPKKRIVVFMDEIDGTMAVDKSVNSRHNEDITNSLKRAITYLQEECDNIIFIGATNKDPNGIKSDNVSVRLNPAILSRFKYQMEIGLPNKDAIQDAWSKLMKTGSGKDKFTPEQNVIIAQHFHELGMSFRDMANIADKLNRQDAVEFCKKGSYNSKVNLIKVLQNDEKIGYDPVKKENLPKEKLQQIIADLKSSFGFND